MSKKHKAILATLIIMFVITVDQIVKVAVKTNMYLGEHIDVTSWFKIRFVENNGMAFGMELFGKYFLTSFRLIACIGMGWYLKTLIKKNVSTAFICSIALIMAGALGNVIDCLFYGLVFNNPPYPMTAQFVDWGSGYGDFMLGRVVDMFYFPLVEWDMPADWTWMNSIRFLPDAGEHCVFFSAIFNVADAAVCSSIAWLLILMSRQQKKEHHKQ